MGRSAAFFLLLFSLTAQAAPPVEITVYTYDSLASKEGWGGAIFPAFERESSCRVRALASGDAGQMLARLEIDFQRGKPEGQVILGIDAIGWAKARNRLADWGAWTPRGYARIPRRLRLGNGFLPYDYGYYAMIVDRAGLAKAGLAAPTSVRELLGPAWRRNLLIEDPRTSAPGLAFLLYSRDILGKDAPDFWERLRSQWLTLPSGWAQAYSLFLKGEAPMVWSYTTSQAYHVEHGDPRVSGHHRYEAVLFSEGQPIQIEGAALVRGAPESAAQARCARKFLEFLISEKAQRLVPLTNWMLPARRGTRLPASFRSLPAPKKIIAPHETPAGIASTLEGWSRALAGVKGPPSR